MKKIFIAMALTVFVLPSLAAQQAAIQPPIAAEISFNYTRLAGRASNQFAIWIEDAQGQYVKTIYATRWTAAGGWSRRPTSIPVWINRAGVAELTRAQVDVVSGATPRTGALVFTWDGTDSRGAAVPPGDYVIFLEGTLRWENQVLFSAPIRLGAGPQTPEVTVQFTGDATDDRVMLRDVRVTVY
jgi:hypothetical protein